MGVVSADGSTGNTFEAIDQLGQLNNGRVVDQEVDVVGFSVELG